MDKRKQRRKGVLVREVPVARKSRHGRRPGKERGRSLRAEALPSTAWTFLLAVLLLVLAASLFTSSCGAGNNASPRELEELLRAVRHYWENEKDYTLNYPNAVDDIVSAVVKGDEAEVEVEIVLGYLEPTEGAGYKTVTFKLRREDGTWKVTYDGWIGEEV
jgi:hypothetical protein